MRGQNERTATDFWSDSSILALVGILLALVVWKKKKEGKAEEKRGAPEAMYV